MEAVSDQKQTHLCPLTENEYSYRKWYLRLVEFSLNYLHLNDSNVDSLTFLWKAFTWTPSHEDRKWASPKRFTNILSLQFILWKIKIVKKVTRIFQTSI